MPRLICGQYGADDVTTSSGRAYVLRLRPNGTVAHTQAIHSGNGGLPGTVLTTHSAFGSGVAGDLGDVDGDGLNDVAVSAPGWDEPQPNGGAIFIFFMHSNDTVRDFNILTNEAFGGLS